MMKTLALGCASLLVLGCSASPVKAIVAGRYSGSVDGVDLFLDVSADGTYYRWWMAQGGFSEIKNWSLRELKPGILIAVFENLGDDSMIFLVRDSGRKLELINAGVSGVLDKQ